MLIRRRFSLLNRVTQGGHAFQDMMRYIHSRGLPKSLDTSGANRAGNAIRAYLCGKYNIEEEKSVAVKLPPNFFDNLRSRNGEEIRGQTNEGGDTQA